MNPNPFSDVVAFVTNPVWTTAVFWLLVLASVVIAVYVWNRLPEQRTFSNTVQWAIRLVMGAFWWQQSLWKLPPLYTDHPEAAFGETGLAYWMGLMGKHAAIPLQADFVNNIVLPHFYLFAPVVYSLEVLTSVSLMLGAFVRLFGIIGALQILNLWLGLYSAPGEWPWTYFFLLLLQVMFAIHCYGRSLGVDAVLKAERSHRTESGLIRRLVAAST
jgi:uncharacterized membrane protein YphA (DoxX/SURF4 family)